MEATTPRRPSVRSPRGGSQSARAREWVKALPEYTFFRLGDIPDVTPGVAAKALSEMVKAEEGIERVAQGCYIRTAPDSYRIDYAPFAMRYAGPGSGYGSLSALSKLRWAWQSPVKTQIAVVGRTPRAQFPYCAFLARTNPNRRWLTWAEVTVLEGLRTGRFGDFPWKDALDFFLGGTSLSSLGEGAVIRREALMRAGNKEMSQQATYYERLRELVEKMPSRMECRAR